MDIASSFFSCLYGFAKVGVRVSYTNARGDFNVWFTKSCVIHTADQGRKYSLCCSTNTGSNWCRLGKSHWYLCYKALQTDIDLLPMLWKTEPLPNSNKRPTADVHPGPALYPVISYSQAIFHHSLPPLIHMTTSSVIDEFQSGQSRQSADKPLAGSLLLSKK